MTGYDGPFTSHGHDGTYGPGPHIPLPRYTPSIVATCPDCSGDLQHEGADGYWCPGCRKAYGFMEVALFDDGDINDE